VPQSRFEALQHNANIARKDVEMPWLVVDVEAGGDQFAAVAITEFGTHQIEPACRQGRERQQ
jgi:hypothetical protein